MIAMLNGAPLAGGGAQATGGRPMPMDGYAGGMLPRSRSSFASMGGSSALGQKPVPGIAPTPTTAQPTMTPAPGAQPTQTTSTSTTGGASSGANGVNTQAMVTPPAPSAGSVPTTGFAASNPVAPVPLGSAANFGPLSNSVGTVIAPETSARLGGIQGDVNGAIAGLSSAPDRYALATKEYGTYADATDPQYQQSLRDAEKYGSANGLAGSGMLRTSFGNLALQRGRDLQNERDTLFNTAQQATMQDRTATLASLLGAESQVNAQDASARGEQRTERQYQADAGNTAHQQAINDALVNDQLTNSAFGRAATQTQMGYGNDPSLAELTAAGEQGDAAQSGFQNVGQLMQLLAMSQGSGNLTNILRLLGSGNGGTA